MTSDQSEEFSFEDLYQKLQEIVEQREIYSRTLNNKVIKPKLGLVRVVIKYFSFATIRSGSYENPAVSDESEPSWLES